MPAQLCSVAVSSIMVQNGNTSPSKQSRTQQPQLLQFSNAQTQSPTQLYRPRIFNARRAPNPKPVQPKRHVQHLQPQRSQGQSQSQSQSQSFQTSQPVRLHQPYTFARRATPNAKDANGNSGVRVKASANTSANKNANATRNSRESQGFSPAVRSAWNSPVQKANNVQKQELQGYLKLLNCKYPGHSHADCSYPPPFNANLAQWGDRLRADYPPTNPQEQALYANKEKFNNAYMVKRYGKFLGMDKPRRVRTNWGQGARSYGPN